MSCLPDRPRVAVIIPCYNEAPAIGKVIDGFRGYLPDAHFYVADNASSDNTADVARAHGATVIYEARRGKANAVLRLFADVDADMFIMVDGDGTYDPSAAPQLVDLVLNGGYDHVNVARAEDTGAQAAYRPGHRLGNKMLTLIFQRLFGLPITDSLSGYRGFSRRFAKTFASPGGGFSLEAELNVHTAELNMPFREMSASYFDRIEGTVSKLNTYKDGITILRRNLQLFTDARPVTSFNLMAAPWFVISVYFVLTAVIDYWTNHGYVLKVPSLVAGVSAFVVAINLVIAGLIMKRIARTRVDNLRLRYLSIGRS